MLPGIRACIETAQKQKMTAAGLFERITTETSIANKKGTVRIFPDSRCQAHHDSASRGRLEFRMAGQPSTKVAEINGAELARVAAEKLYALAQPEAPRPRQVTP